MTRIYYDADRRALFISGVVMAFAPKSLSYVRDGALFEIWLGGIKRLVKAPVSELRDGFGAAFANADACAAYLAATFAIDPFAPPPESELPDLTLIFNNGLI